jgi:hypothetical protein
MDSCSSTDQKTSSELLSLRNIKLGQCPAIMIGRAILELTRTFRGCSASSIGGLESRCVLISHFTLVTVQRVFIARLLIYRESLVYLAISVPYLTISRHIRPYPAISHHIPPQRGAPCGGAGARQRSAGPLEARHMCPGASGVRRPVPHSCHAHTRASAYTRIRIRWTPHSGARRSALKSRSRICAGTRRRPQWAPRASARGPALSRPPQTRACRLHRAPPQ